MSFILCVVLVVWLACVQQKLNAIEKTVENMNSKLNRSVNSDYPAQKTEIAAEDKSSENVVAASSASENHIEKEPVSSNFQEQPYNESKQAAKSIDKTPSKSDFQSVFLGNVFNKIGAITIIIAVIIFIKLVSPFIHLTPQMTVGMSYFAGLGLVFGALYMHRQEKLKNYAEVVLGTGFGALFINTFCAYSYFKVFSTPVAIAVGAVLLISTYFIADRMKTVSMLVIGLIGGYLTPFLSGADNNVIFSYLVFLNLISLIYTLKNKHNRAVNLVNLILTMFIMLGYNIAGKMDTVYPVVLWLIYIVYDILRDKSSKVDTVLSGINYFVLTIFTLLLYHDNHFGLGSVFASTAVGYLVLAVISRMSKNNLYRYYEHYVLVNLWLFILFILNDVNSVISWAIIPFIITCLIRKFKLEYMKGMAVWYYFAAFAAVLTANIDGNYCLFAHYNPIINLRALIVGVPALSMIASALLLKDSNKNLSNVFNFGGISLIYLYVVGEINSLYSASQTGAIKIFNQISAYIILGFVYSMQMKRLYNNTKFLLYEIVSYIFYAFSIFALIISSYFYPQGYMSILNMRVAGYFAAIVASIMFMRWTKFEVFKYIAVILGFFLIHSECVGVKNLYGDQFQYVISLGWVLYSGAITTIGIIRNKNFLKYSGIILSLLTVARIFIFDLSQVDAIYKLIICLVLGAILMFVSYIYTSRNKN